MRRVLTLALIAVALVGMAAPGAYAQAPAPAPQVTISGFVDTITSWTKNMRDNNFARTGDTHWSTRNRGRFDVIGSLGRAKTVLGLEIDSNWGQVSASDNSTTGGVGAFGTAQRPGSSSAFDLQTDTLGSIEVKWLYVEFPLPLVPFPTVIRMGAQPFAVQYKLAAYANGDFPGVNLVTTFSPNVKWHFTYVQIEEDIQGPRAGSGFNRGDDFAIVTSVEVTPFKGLDLRPIFSVIHAEGTTFGQTRPAVGGVPNPLSATGSPTFGRGGVGGVGGQGLHEDRFTVGIDARFRSGPFSLDPTFFYQFGNRDTDNPYRAAGATNATSEADISAMFFDVIGGWRIGPLLLEGRFVYVSGNRPRDQLHQDINYYQPLATDTSYWGAGWGEILSLGIDYFNGAIRGLGANIGLDRYGRQQFAARAIYSVTPAFDVRMVVSPAWTARSVDTDGSTAGGVITASANRNKGDESYIGTEANLGMTWRFAPGLAFDLVGGVLFTGGALDTTETINGVATKRDSVNAYTIASRVRYSF